MPKIKKPFDPFFTKSEDEPTRLDIHELFRLKKYHKELTPFIEKAKEFDDAAIEYDYKGNIRSPRFFSKQTSDNLIVDQRLIENRIFEIENSIEYAK